MKKYTIQITESYLVEDVVAETDEQACIIAESAVAMNGGKFFVSHENEIVSVEESEETA